MGWRFWLSEPERILDETQSLAVALECMDDEVSQRCMVNIAAFRLGLNTVYASFQHPENQYFNPLTLNAFQGNALRFVDGGAYNGDTYLELCSVANVQKAYLFEPDGANFAQLTKNVAQTGRMAECLPLGLSDSHQILSFNAGSGEGAAISENGTSHIAVAALDDVLTGCAVDFIKLDVEGAELQALQGARKLIQRRARCWPCRCITARKTCGSYHWRSPAGARTTASMCASITSTVLKACCTQCRGTASPNT
jgi:FkbM family methyltransferase